MTESICDTNSAAMDIVVAGNVVMMAEKSKDEAERVWIHLKENDISVKVSDGGEIRGTDFGL